MTVGYGGGRRRGGEGGRADGGGGGTRYIELAVKVMPDLKFSEMRHSTSKYVSKNLDFEKLRSPNHQRLLQLDEP